jgi:hypothetical protein
MKKMACAAVAAGFVVTASAVPASAQGFSAASLIWHSSVVSYCEGRELTQQEAQGTAIGWSSMWQAMRDCDANRAKRAAAEAQKSAAAAKKKK